MKINIFYKIYYFEMKINIFYKIYYFIIKIVIFSLLMFLILQSKIYIENEILKINDNYLYIQNYSNITFQNKIKSKIKIGIFTIGLKNGGRARITSQLLKYLNKIEIFDIYLFTIKIREENEYINVDLSKRILIKNYTLYRLIKEIEKKKIDIFLYQLSNVTEINFFNNLKNLKIIFYLHQSLLYWVYFNYSIFKSLYKTYQNSKYVICLVPFENDYLFKKWGISSILMNNFITFEYDFIISSKLSSKIIIMIGRGADKYKRFSLGIQSMEYILEDLPKSEMKIISDIEYIFVIKDLIDNLNLQYNIKFIGFTSTPEFHLKNASLHIFPTLSESFGLVLSETKIYGIPNILLGLDYVTIAKKGTIIIYDDTPESIAKESLKILQNDNYRENLGNDARKSMKKLDNKLLIKKWINLILSIYNSDIYYDKLRFENKKYIFEKNLIYILKKHIELLKMRNIFFSNITINNICNFSFLDLLN